MTTSRLQRLLDQLLPEDLSGVTFVRDYLQLEFNPPPRINVYSACAVVLESARTVFGQPAFANAVIGQIGKQVTRVTEDPDQVLRISFEDGSVIEIPFGPGTFEGPEAITFWGKDDQWASWPS